METSEKESNTVETVFKVNDLVRVKSDLSLGICTVARVMKHSKVEITFGKYDKQKIKTDLLELVDTSKCPTMTMEEFRQKRMDNTLDMFIVGHELCKYVGIGIVTHSLVTEEDLKLYPRLVH